jgi:hypothetical protein
MQDRAGIHPDAAIGYFATLIVIFFDITGGLCGMCR